MSTILARTDHQQIIHTSCEHLKDSEDLGRFLETHKERKGLLLDEITFVKDWDRAIKHFVDSRPFDVLIATGSNSADLRRGADTMPGRFRGGGEYFLRPMGQIALTMGSSISLQKLAQRTQMGSHHTVQSYIELLEDSFALRTLHAIDLDTGAFRFEKEKKFYFTDPLMYWIALSEITIRCPENYQEKMVEMVAAEHLFRAHKKLGYLATAAGEVDFIAMPDTAIEVKWSSQAQNLSKAFQNLRLPQKTVWYQENFLLE